MDGSETGNGVEGDGEEGYRELYNKLDGEHGEEEKEVGKPIVCKKHLGLSLRAINENIDENPEVLQILEGQAGDGKVEFSQFKGIMGDLEKAGWKKVSKKKLLDITDVEILAIFRLCDTTKSGSISEREAKMGVKLLKKRLGVTDAEAFMREFDTDSDGKLSFTEFQKAVEKLKERESEGLI